MHWIQQQLTLPAFSKGIHSITRLISGALPEISQIEIGMLHLFLQHTSASISINENADPDVPLDLEMSLDKIVPETLPYKHVIEGRDDMPAHVKSSLVGNSLSIPVGQGRLLLGTWQGIYLCEHRQSTHRRHLILTLCGKREK